MPQPRSAKSGQAGIDAGLLNAYERHRTERILKEFLCRQDKGLTSPYSARELTTGSNARIGGKSHRPTNRGEQCRTKRRSWFQPPPLSAGNGRSLTRNGRHSRRRDTGDGRSVGSHPAPRRRVARPRPGHTEPNGRGPLRVHVQEPAALTGPRRICSPRWVRPWRNGPSSGTDLTDPVTGEPVLQDGNPVVVTKDHNDALSENPNPLLTSGFTFVGQFVDHDITFDTTPLDEQRSDPYATTNFRSPRYDLDADLRTGPEQGPAALRPGRPGQVLDRQAPLQRDQGSPDDARCGLRPASRRRRQEPRSPTRATTRR